MIGRIGIGAGLQQRTDERQRAVVNRIFEARADGQRHRPIRHAGRIIDCIPQCGKITRAKSGVDRLELLVFCASLSV